jgi:predicted DsbA family dithiol-disulfide isomerase
MPVPVKIDFVSDIACPWCAVGLKSLEAAIQRVGPGLQVELRFQPFELNPRMAPAGEDTVEHLTRKYGITAAQVAHNAAALHARGQALGFEFALEKRTRIYNTFDAHRLLHWAQALGEGHALRLKHALLRGYLGEGRNVSDAATLVALAIEAGLDGEQARRLLASDTHAQAVRERQRVHRQQGIDAVPSVIFNERHLVQGGQPVETFERVLRQLSGIKAPEPA